MSNYWDLGCKTCNEPAHAFYVNHGDDDILALLPGLQALAKVDGAIPAWAGARIQWHSGQECDFGDLLRFLNKHDGHELDAKSEYGYWRSDPEH